MSQSPTGSGPGSDTGTGDGYRASWDDLARRVRARESFSGHERDVAFLNTGEAGGGRFADASGAVLFDDAGDGRALAVTDWDRDGDVDVWMTSRTGPRLRYFENTAADGGDGPGPVQVLPEGDPGLGCPRDAVGAKVRVRFASGDGEGLQLVRAVVAGDGFLGQSSRWLHFGVPPGCEVVGVEVRWPGAPGWEPVDGVAGAGAFLVRQGEGAAPVAAGAAAPGDSGLPARTRPPVNKRVPDSAARVDLSADPLVLGEEVRFRGVGGRGAEGRSTVEGPAFLIFWASWCPVCAAQMESLAAAGMGAEIGGIPVVALSVDALVDGEVDTDGIAKHARDHRFAGLVGSADQELVAGVERALAERFYRRDPMPLPTTLLLDAGGRVPVLYRGRFDPAVAGADAEAMREGRLGEAVAPALAGRETDGLFPASPVAIARVYLDGGYPEDARDHLTAYLEREGEGAAGGADDATRRGRLGDVHYMLGVVEARDGDLAEAIPRFRSSLGFNPGLRPARMALAELLGKSGDPAGAERELLVLTESDPADADPVVELAELRLQLGRTAEAASGFRRAVSINPKHVQALVGLTWVLATAPEGEGVRDGEEALRTAIVLERSPFAADPRVADVVAAAYAAAGDFGGAEVRAGRAAQAARAAGDLRMAEAIERRRLGYSKGEAWSVPAPAPGTGDRGG